MAEYISREAVLKAFKLIAKNPNKDYQRGMQDAIDCLVPEVIADIPTADVQPVKHGRWIKVQDKQGDYFLCSNCGTAEKTESGQDGAVWWHDEYCRKCGARMDGEQDE